MTTKISNSENAILMVESYLSIIMGISKKKASIHAKIIICEIEKHILKGEKL
jgi:hypothetical protein